MIVLKREEYEALGDRLNLSAEIRENRLTKV